LQQPQEISLATIFSNRARVAKARRSARREASEFTCQLIAADARAWKSLFNYLNTV